MSWNNEAMRDYRVFCCSDGRWQRATTTFVTYYGQPLLLSGAKPKMVMSPTKPTESTEQKRAQLVTLGHIPPRAKKNKKKQNKKKKEKRKKDS